MGVIEHSNMIDNAVTLGGGAGAITPTAVTVADPTTMNLGSVAGVPLVVAGAPGASNDQGALVVVGCNDPGFEIDGLDAYSGSSYGLYGRSTSAAGVKAISTSGTGLSADSTSGAGVIGASTSGTGVQGTSGTQDGVAGTGARYGGYFTGGAAALYVNGHLQLPDVGEPATPDAGIVIWGAAGVLHAKGPDGVDHALW